jgi:hypothetical protein
MTLCGLGSPVGGPGAVPLLGLSVLIIFLSTLLGCQDIAAL